MRQIILGIIAVRKMPVGYAEIAGVIRANWRRIDGKPIKDRLIGQVIKALSDENVLTFVVIKGSRYYRVIGKDTRTVYRCNLLEPIAKPTHKPAPKITTPINTDEWLADLNVPKSSIQSFTRDRRPLENFLAERELRRKTVEVWAWG